MAPLKIVYNTKNNQFAQFNQCRCKILLLLAKFKSRTFPDQSKTHLSYYYSIFFNKTRAYCIFNLLSSQTDSTMVHINLHRLTAKSNLRQYYARKENAAGGCGKAGELRRAEIKCNNQMYLQQFSLQHLERESGKHLSGNAASQTLKAQPLFPFSFFPSVYPVNWGVGNFSYGANSFSTFPLTFTSVPSQQVARVVRLFPLGFSPNLLI